MQQQHNSPACNIRLELPGNALAPTDESDCEMEIQDSPTWPPQRSSPCSSGSRVQKASSCVDATAGMISPQGMAGHGAVQFPFGSYSASAVKGHSTVGAAPGQLPTATTAGGSPVLPPKLLKAVEKAPNSPSDMPASGSNLRKVALLRALLVRTRPPCNTYPLKLEFSRTD